MRLGVEYTSDNGDFIQLWDSTYTYCVELQKKSGAEWFQAYGFINRNQIVRLAFHEVLDITTDERAYAALDGDCNFILTECEALAGVLIAEYMERVA